MSVLCIRFFFIDLHKAWTSKNGYFIGLVCLLSVSFLLYLLSSLVDPGFLPKPDPKDIAIKASETKVHNHFSKCCMCLYGSPTTGQGFPDWRGTH